jgi:hypothetical protein
MRQASCGTRRNRQYVASRASGRDDVTKRQDFRAPPYQRIDASARLLKHLPRKLRQRMPPNLPLVRTPGGIDIEAPLEGLVLRYGLFYGPGTGFDVPIAPGSVHVDVAAKAAELAVTRGERGIYNVTESDGATSSERAIEAFGWDSSWRSGTAV